MGNNINIEVKRLLEVLKESAARLITDSRAQPYALLYVEKALPPEEGRLLGQIRKNRNTNEGHGVSPKDPIYPKEWAEFLKKIIKDIDRNSGFVAKQLNEKVREYYLSNDKRQQSQFMHNGAKFPQKKIGATSSETRDINANYKKQKLTTEQKEIVRLMEYFCNYEKLNKAKWNFSALHKYSGWGCEFSGKNAKVFVRESGWSCFEEDDEYDIYEIPSKSSHGPEGEFMFAAKNLEKKYTIFGVLTYNVNIKKSLQQEYLYVNVGIKPYGKYTIRRYSNGDCSVLKEEYGVDCLFSYATEDEVFDYNEKRLGAYGTCEYQLFQSIELF